MASWGLYPFRRPELVGFVPDAQASVALPAVAVAGAAPQVAVEVERVVAVAADLHVVAVADVPRVVLVDSEPVQVHDASVVVAAVAEQLHVVAAVVVVVARVLRRVRPAAVVDAQVWQHAQLALHHDRLGAAPARCAVGRVGHVHYHAAVEQAAPAAEQPVVVPSVLAEHRDARLSPGTSVPSRAQVQYSRAGPSPDSDGIAALPALCS